MSIEQNKAIARRFIEEGWHNIDILDEVLADRIVFTGGEVVSLAACRRGQTSPQARLMVN